MEIITRDQAIQQGLNRYFTGAACPHGHVAARRVVNRACTACDASTAKRRYETLRHDDKFMDAARKRARDWAVKNPDRYKARQAQWRSEHRQEQREYDREWRSRNPGYSKRRYQQNMENDPEFAAKVHKRRYADPAYAAKAKARAKVWRKQNAHRYQELLDRWKIANPERYRAIQRAGTLNRRARMRAVGKLSVTDIEIVRARNNCAACGDLHHLMEIDHIIALSRGGHNHLSNLQLLCRPCNRSKWSKDMIAWAKERGFILTPQ